MGQGTIQTKENTDVVTLTASILLFDATKYFVHSTYVVLVYVIILNRITYYESIACI